MSRVICTLGVSADGLVGGPRARRPRSRCAAITRVGALRHLDTGRAVPQPDPPPGAVLGAPDVHLSGREAALAVPGVDAQRVERRRHLEGHEAGDRAARAPLERRRRRRRRSDPDASREGRARTVTLGRSRGRAPVRVRRDSVRSGRSRLSDPGRPRRAQPEVERAAGGIGVGQDSAHPVGVVVEDAERDHAGVQGDGVGGPTADVEAPGALEAHRLAGERVGRVDTRRGLDPRASQPGWACASTAAAPATCGVAIDVPSMRGVVLVDRGCRARCRRPGRRRCRRRARRSRA